MREIALIGFAQTLFFSFLITTKENKGTKDYLLIVTLLVVGAELLHGFLLKTILESENKWIELLDISYWTLFGPVTLMYILFTIKREKKIRAVHFLNLIPILIYLLNLKSYFFGNVESFKEFIHESTGLTLLILNWGDFISPVYILFSLYIIIIHNKRVKNYFSDISQKDLTWLILLISGFVLYLSGFYINGFIKDVLLIQTNFDALKILPAILTIYVFVIGYYGYKQIGIFSDYPVNKEGLIRKSFRVADNKYVKSGLSDSERAKLIINLKEVMETEKSYLENDLNIHDLAKMLNTTFHKLSQVINESFHQNFFDFINTYRIEESKHLLKNPESKKYTIISIAYDCGFSSKSSFYKAFKKNIGTTPMEYIKRQNLFDQQ